MRSPASTVSRVLIVEDEPAMLRGLSRLMQMVGHEPVMAASVGESLKMLDSDLTHVFLDMNLPDGFGTAVLQEIRSRKLSAKVAVLSGTTDDLLIEEARSLLADVIFKKPADVDRLLDWLGS